MKLTRRILAVMLACVMALCMLTACGGGGGGGTSGGGSGSASAASTKEEVVVNAINSVRKSKGLSEVEEVKALDEMAAQGSFANVEDGDKTYVPATGLKIFEGLSSSDLNNIQSKISDFACEDFDYIGISVSDSSFYSGYYKVVMSGYKLQ